MTSTAPPQPSLSLTIEQILQQAIAHHQAGRLQEADTLYQSILQIQPHHAAANHNMGVLAAETKQLAAALPHFLTALEAEPTHGPYWTSYIGALIQAEQYEAAREVLAIARQQGLEGEEVEAFAVLIDGERLTAQTDNPLSHNKSEPAPHEMNTLLKLVNEGRYAEVEALAQTMTLHYPLHGLSWKILGAAFKHLGNNEAALLPMQKAAVLMPDDAASHGNLGMAFKDMGRLDEAATSFRRATEIKPDFAEAHHNLGKTLKELGRLDEAEASFRHVQQIHRDYAVAHFEMGNSLQSLGRLGESEACYLRALQLSPDFFEAHNNLGTLYVDQGRLNEAEASFRSALEINPVLVDAHYNLGNTLKDMNRFNEAEASYRRALEFKPDYAEAYNNLGMTLQDMGRLDEAKANYQHAYRLGYFGANTKAALMLPAIMGTSEQVLESRAVFERNLDRLIQENIPLADPLLNVGSTNFYLAYHGLNDLDLQIKVAKYYELVCPSLLYAAPHCIKPESAPQKKIRVGFFSKFLFNHSVSLCFSKIIETLSANEQFEVNLISSKPVDEKVYAGFVGNCIHLPFHLAQAREMLAALELDILIYLDIGMEPLSYFLAFSRLARVQCVWAGHPVTTGIANIDYFLSTGKLEPVGAEAHYSEKLVCLPKLLVYFTRPTLPATLKTRVELNFPDGRHIYICPMKLQKLHPDFDEAITRILQIDENGVVVLCEDDFWAYWKTALMARFESSIPAEVRERIIFLPWFKSRTDFISAIAASDVILDPFHFGIGSTAAMTFVTGTPLVTRTGEFMRGRFGAYFCEMMGTTECITVDTEAYARKAVEIASDRLLRERISAKILKNNSVLYENMQPVEDFVNFLYSLADNGRGI